MIMTAHGQNEHRMAFDIVWTIDLGAGMDRNGVLSKRRLEPRIHNFFTNFECHAETMQITPNERLRRQSDDADRKYRY